MSNVAFRVTIEGPQGAGKSRLTMLVAAQLQVLGFKSIRITECDDDSSRAKSLGTADAEIIVRQL